VHQENRTAPCRGGLYIRPWQCKFASAYPGAYTMRPYTKAGGSPHPVGPAIGRPLGCVGRAMRAPTRCTRKIAPHPVGADYISARGSANLQVPTRAHIQCAPTPRIGGAAMRAGINPAPTVKPGAWMEG